MVASPTAPAGPPPTAFEHLVDRERYPIDAPDTQGYRELVQRCRDSLADDGCAVLAGFFRSDAVERIQGEARALAPRAYFRESYVNVYSTTDDPDLPVEHPARFFMKRTSAFVPGDEIAAEGTLKAIYHAAAFKRFVADCVEEEAVHEYADPLAGLVLNVIEPGAQQPWHFDTNEFIVSTMAQAPDAGGLFEYCPNIRTPTSENYERVGRVLRDEDRSEVRTLRLAPGDIQIFKGRFALHRVAPVEGQRTRLTAIFAYAKEPGMVGKLERTNQLFGRITEVHRQAAHAPRRSDGLVD